MLICLSICGSESASAHVAAALEEERSAAKAEAERLATVHAAGDDGRLPAKSVASKVAVE